MDTVDAYGHHSNAVVRLVLEAGCPEAPDLPGPFVADVWLGFKMFFIKIRIFNLLLGGPWVALGWPAWGWKYSPRP